MINYDQDTVELHPMKFMDIYKDIAVELPVQPNINIVRIEINKVIRRINDEIGLFKQLIKVTPGTITKSIDGMTTTVIQSLSTTNIEDFGRFKWDWDWNTTEYRLRLSDDVMEVLEVFLEDVEWEQVDYPKVKDSDNSSDKIFAQVGRWLYFPVDLSTETDILRIRVKRQYSFVNQVLDKDQIIDVPETYRQLLISGVVIALTSRPKYKDVDIFNVNKEIFEREYINLRTQYNNLEPSYESRDMTYKY
jgi:hypothetical protein